MAMAKYYRHKISLTFLCTLTSDEPLTDKEILEVLEETQEIPVGIANDIEIESEEVSS